MLKIAVSSGKGGTGKTFISTNLAKTIEKSGKKISCIDCDVEEPNGHLFLKPLINDRENSRILSPAEIDENKCIACGKCEEACHYNAITVVNNRTLLFQNLCHTCGACTIVCPTGAVIEKERKIGEIIHGKSGNMDFHYGLLETAEGGMSPRLIKSLKKYTSEGINIFDSPPGTACSAVETVSGTDLTVLVTDPTPFGVNDLKLSVNMCRKLGIEPVVVVNRADYMNSILKDYCRDDKLEIIGEIPDDRKIASYYSNGMLAVNNLPEYNSVFEKLAEKIIKTASEKRPLRKPPSISAGYKKEDIVDDKESRAREANAAELVVISGKGGTGKTSLVASFCALEKNIAIADCDVDAADLHLVLQPEVIKKGLFSGSDTAYIDQKKCTNCGKCYDNCRFNAVDISESGGKTVFKIDETACEGCGVCCIVCPAGATICEPAVNGEWYNSKTRFGPMSHAKLGVAEENSGRLVTLVKNHKNKLAFEYGLRNALIDGSPGTGCPVIASITGARYALIVTEPTVSGIHDLNRIIDVANFFKIRSGVIVNRYDLNTEKTEEIQSITEKNGSDYLGKLPYDKRVTEAQVEGVSVVEYTDEGITKEIIKIWDKLKELAYNNKS